MSSTGADTHHDPESEPATTASARSRSLVTVTASWQAVDTGTTSRRERRRTAKAGRVSYGGSPGPVRTSSHCRHDRVIRWCRRWKNTVTPTTLTATNSRTSTSGTTSPTRTTLRTSGTGRRNTSTTTAASGSYSQPTPLSKLGSAYSLAPVNDTEADPASDLLHAAPEAHDAYAPHRRRPQTPPVIPSPRESGEVKT